MVVRGTTPDITLTVPDTVDLTAAETVYATIKQGKTVLTKTSNEFELQAHAVIIYLSQEESLQFADGEAEVQLNWIFGDGRRNATKVKTISFDRQLLGRVLP